MRWTIKPVPPSSKVSHLMQSLGVDRNIATLLLQRNIETYDEAKAFFRPRLEDLHDPFLMEDMEKAVERIERAFDQGEKILVYGDYDVDGTTAVALMSSYLKTRTPWVATYIPDRYQEGYGVSYQGIDYAQDNEISLIIALDCGIKAMDKVAYANERGIDFIICDHHRPGAEIPQAVAVLDPKRSDCSYPYDELCGCGVGFKLVQALAQREGKTIDQLVDYLDLVATAIGADIVPITGENRILATFGLAIINSRPRPGFKAIIAQTKKKEFTITDVVFIIAPRINAAGRMKHGNYAVSLLTEPDWDKAQQLAAQIEQFNLARKEADQQITQEALVQIETYQEQKRFTSVVFHESWNKGVIGIVASRLIETYYRPTLVFTRSGDRLAASARSISGFDVYNALEACSHHLEQFGGHKYAAGLTIKEENYEAFKQAFEDHVSQTIDKALLVPEVKVDMRLNFQDITPKFYRILKQFAPFGPGNMAPIFMTEAVSDYGYAKCVGEDDKHLKASLLQKNIVKGTMTSSARFEAIGFNLGHQLAFLQGGQRFDVVYSIDENHWQDKVSLQLKLRDIKSN